MKCWLTDVLHVSYLRLIDITSNLFSWWKVWPCISMPQPATRWWCSWFDFSWPRWHYRRLQDYRFRCAINLLYAYWI